MSAEWKRWGVYRSKQVAEGVAFDLTRLARDGRVRRGAEALIERQNRVEIEVAKFGATRWQVRYREVQP